VAWIPSLLRSLTGGETTVRAEGETVGQLIDSLEQRFPGIRARLCEENQLRPGISVIVDGQVSPRKLRQTLANESEVHFVQVISGGCRPMSDGDVGLAMEGE
jgi:molybdopterin synthase sulfur carrier subunit